MKAAPPKRFSSYLYLSIIKFVYPLGAFGALLGALLEVIKKALLFGQEFQVRKPSYAALLTRNESTVSYENEILEQFVDSLWKAIDQTCVPALMLNYESIECLAVFKSFFEIQANLSLSEIIKRTSSFIQY